MDSMVELYEMLLRLADYNRWVAALKGYPSWGSSREEREARADAYTTAAKLLWAEIEKKEITMKFLLEQASDHTREEVVVVEIATLEQLLELVSTVGHYKTWYVGIIVSEITPTRKRFPDVKWNLIIYDDWLE